MFFPMTNWKGWDDKPDPPTDPKRPSACATRRPGDPQSRTFCNRLPDHGEFVFQDAKRAHAFYANPKGPGIRMCRECAAAWIAENPKETKQ